MFNLTSEEVTMLDGILAKLAANPGKRILPFAITRCWDDEKGWVFSIK